MAELRCNPDDAFTYLTTLSKGPEPKVRDIAAEIVHRTQQIQTDWARHDGWRRSSYATCFN
jgi:hypothetical protein